MRKKGTVYNSVNVLVELVTAGLFLYRYKNFTEVFSDGNAAQFVLLILVVVLVHIVKAGRVYLALYDSGLRGIDYIKEYCKATSVSMIFPFKLGELFRMYCFGKLIGNALKGGVIILLDRFMDTAALVSVTIFIRIWTGGEIANFVYVLLMFLVFALIIYLLFPRIYIFWNKHLLDLNATQNRLRALKFLSYLNGIYREVEDVTKGRGIILYFMSMIAWGVEIGSLYLLNNNVDDHSTYRIVSDYLTSAISGHQSIELERFVVTSAVFLMGIYIIIKTCGFLRKKDKW